MTVVGPSVPADLVATPLSTSQINLSWASSTDSNALDSHGNPIVVAGYRIFRDSASLATTTATTTTYADTGLSTATTYSYAIEAFDSIGAFSGQSAPVSATTLSPTPPASGSGGGGTSSFIYNEHITADSSNAIITFMTILPAESTVSWGLTPDYEAGSVTSVISETSHEVDLTGLNPETHYYVQITVTATNGAQSTFNTEFTTAGLPGAALPNPSNFTAVPATNAIDLSWTNTPDPRATEVRIVRSETFFPSDQFDGVPIYEGPGQSFLDTSAKPGTKYYYAIFSEGATTNGVGLFSSGALASARIPVPGEAVTFATSTNPFAGIIFATSTNPMIAGLALSDFQFIQEGKQLAIAGNNIIGANGLENMTIRLPYDKVPQILKTIAVTLNDPTDPTKAFIFLLRANTDDTYYEASIGPLGRTAIFPLTVTILDYQNQGLKQLSGSLAALSIGAYLPSSGFNQNWFWLGLVLLIILIVVFAIWNKVRKREEKELERRLGASEGEREPDASPVGDDGVSRETFSSLFLVLAIASILATCNLQPGTAHAAFNPEINYQGKLANASNVTVADGQYPIIFNLYSAATGGSLSGLKQTTA